MGTVQLAEGEAAGSGGETSGCRLLGSCAQTVCPRLAALLSCSPGAGKGSLPPPALALPSELLQLEINLKGASGTCP